MQGGGGSGSAKREAKLEPHADGALRMCTMSFLLEVVTIKWTVNGVSVISLNRARRLGV